MNFTKKDIEQINNYGLNVEMIVNQLETFTRGIPFLDVVTAASVGNGIEVITDNDQKKLISLYEHKKDSLEVVKFVPASGAATRMFQSLHRFLESYDPNKETLNEFLRSESDSELTLFFKSLKDFAFEKKLRKKEEELNELIKELEQKKSELAKKKKKEAAPSAAAPFILARCVKAHCPAATFSALPPHAFNAAACSARP